MLEKLFLRLFRVADLFHDKRFNPAEFLLKPSGETACPVFEEHDETKGKKNKKNDPKYPAQQGHGGNRNRGGLLGQLTGES